MIDLNLLYSDLSIVCLKTNPEARIRALGFRFLLSFLLFFFSFCLVFVVFLVSVLWVFGSREISTFCFGKVVEGFVFLGFEKGKGLVSSFCMFRRG